MTKAVPYTEALIQVLVSMFGKKIKGDVHVHLFVDSFEPDIEEIESLPVINYRINEIPTDPQKLRKVLLREYQKSGSEEPTFACAFKQGDWLLGWAELDTANLDLTYFFFQGTLSTKVKIGFSGNFLGKGAKQKDLNSFVCNIKYLGDHWNNKEVRVETSDIITGTGVESQVIESNDKLQDYINDSFSSSAIVDLGRRLASYTASDLVKYNLSNDKLEEIIRLSGELNATAKLARQLRELDLLGK